MQPTTSTNAKGTRLKGVQSTLCARIDSGPDLKIEEKDYNTPHEFHFDSDEIHSLIPLSQIIRSSSFQLKLNEPSGTSVSSIEERNS